MRLLICRGYSFFYLYLHLSMFYYICVSIFLLFGFTNGQESASNFYKFIDSFASSTYISEESGSSLYDSKRAIQNNPSYWCSAGNHAKDEEVTWIGYLNTKGFIKGVKVSWEYAPELVKFSVSSDGENFRTVIPYKRVSSYEAAFEEIYFFKKLEEVLAVKVHLKNSIHKYFGIREVKLLGGGNPYFLLVSGITSNQEMCLQVEEGLINEENSPIVLDSCINALASGDGRELWKTNSNNQIISAFSDPPKCLVVLNLENLESSKVVLYDCLRALEDGDGKSNWIFESNSQIRLQKHGEASLCISQKNVYGNVPGIHDILLNLDVTVNATSVIDSNHGPENVIDSNLTSYWASSTFSDDFEHLVDLTIDLNQLVEVSRIKIFWEYAPLHYHISTSIDNQNFKVLAENLANPSMVTVDSLKNVEARYIKVSMVKPHPSHGKIENESYLYGIRSVEVQANNLDTVVNYCRDAANSDDARDKYFVEYITEFDKTLTEKLIHIEDDVSKHIESISNNLAKLEESLPNIETCLGEKKTYSEQIKESNEKANDLNDKVSAIVSVNTMHSHDLLRLGVFPGDSSSYPAEDCSVIKNLKENVDSGFYWIKPRCASEPLRVFCDMNSGSSIYIWNGNLSREPDQLITNEINSVEDIRYHCAEVGLEPLILRSKNQLSSLILALKKIGFSLNGKINIPLAYDYSCDHGGCSGKFHDLLNGSIDLTTLIYLKTSESPDSTKNRQTAGISYDDGSFKFFNLESSDISAIACSTNSNENDVAVPYLNITCETTALEDHFNSIVNTNILVLCPAGCDTERFSHIPVYGSKGVYSDNSSICRAAIHSNVIDTKGGIVNVAIESGLDYYEGSVNNNIESISLNKNQEGLFDIITKEEKSGQSGADEKEGSGNSNVVPVKQESSPLNHRTIRISHIIEDCPLDLFQVEQTSFLQKEGSVYVPHDVKYSEFDSSDNKDVVNIQELLNSLLSHIDAIHGVDASVIGNVQEETIRVLEKTKKELKPADILSKQQIEEAINLYNVTENLAVYLYELSSRYIFDLEKLKERLDELKGIQKVAYNFGTFKLNYETMNFSSHFYVFDSKTVKNKPSSWGYVDSDVNGHKNSVGQTKSIFAKEIGEGTFAKLKGLNFFDSEIVVSMLAKGTGCIGVMFRAKDDFNFYLFELCDHENVKRLSKVENGNVYVLKEVPDEVLINNQWNKIKIVNSHASIDVYTILEDQKEVKILSALDERFLSGTVGFYSQIQGQGSFFDDLEIKAQPCLELSKTHSTNSLGKQNVGGSHSSVVTCPYYKETYMHTTLQYTVTNNVDFEWNYQAEKSSDSHYLLCSLKGDKEESRGDKYTFALLKQKPCNVGYFSFDVNVNVNEDVTIGGSAVVHVVFHFVDEANFNALELSESAFRFWSKVNNSKKILSEVNSVSFLEKLKSVDRQWVTVKLHFNETHFKVLVSHKDIGDVKLEATGFDKQIVRLGTVGFHVFNLTEVKFDSIVLSPPVEDEYSHFIQTEAKAKAWAACEKSVHVLNRRHSCETVIHPNEPKETHIQCIKNFCEECCLHHTQLLDSDEKKECEKHCKKNNEFASKLQVTFEKFLNKCVSLEQNEEYKNCDPNDKQCKHKVCVLCCKKHDPSSTVEWKGLSAQDVKDFKEKEIIECQLQCNQTHTS